MIGILATSKVVGETQLIDRYRSDNGIREPFTKDTAIAYCKYLTKHNDQWRYRVIKYEYVK
jgi:hypothetical protein